jgi:1-phosphatidylinositol-4-phosphate 5-kinase
MPDGSYYEGQYEGELPNGKGEFRWPDGVRYNGDWRSGLQDGEGV